MEKIEIEGFIFEIDGTNTKLAHENRTPASVECSCGNCKKFNENREKIFTKGAIEFLKKFELDYKKEDYFTNYSKDAEPPNEVGFYVKGRIIEDKKESISIAPNIRITFEDKDLATNFLPDGLSQPYFMITIWFQKVE